MPTSVSVHLSAHLHVCDACAGKKAIVTAGGIEPLVGLLSGAPGAQRHAATALWGITLDVPFRGRVISAGAVRPLVALSASAESEAQGFAVATLCNLSREASAKKEMLAAEGVDVFIGTSLVLEPRTLEQ